MQLFMLDKPEERIVQHDHHPKHHVLSPHSRCTQLHSVLLYQKDMICHIIHVVYSCIAFYYTRKMILSRILHAQSHILMDRCEYASPQNMLATLNYNISLYMHTTVEDTCYIISWMLLHKPTTVEYLCYILLRMSLNMQTNVVHACNIILGMSWYRHSTVVCCCCI